MGRKGPIHKVLGTALAIVLALQSTLANEATCRSGCHGASQTFKYAVGTTYKYDYDGKIEISLSSAEGQTTGTEVKAQVLLTQEADCNQVLRLQNVQILTQGGKKFGTIPDIEKPIRINFHDGHVEDSICVESGDNQNSINVKRAIASIFQANLKNSHETDVFGLCPTETNANKDGGSFVIHKTRNLNKCQYRENLKQDFLATAFNFNSEIKSSPILNGDYSANLRIKNGILDQATVSEHYLYVPFSVGKKGARAEVTSRLQLTGTSKDAPKAACNEPRSIIFENPHPVNAPGVTVQTIFNAVQETVKTIDVVVGETTAKEFVNLIKIIRVSKKQDLLAVYNQIRSGVGIVGDKETARKLYLDALLRAGNGDNVAVVIELLKNKELTALEEKLVYLGLSIVRHATENSLEAAIGLLDQPNLPREAYLGIGQLAGRYCREHNCKNIPALAQLVKKLVSKIGDSKTANREQENDKVYALKAVTNLHYLNDELVQKVAAIAQDKKAPNRLRVAALEAYLADACKDKIRDSALNILKDIQQDSEVRIKAYLVLAKCPTAKIGNAVKALLEKEPSYQVGGFITSHIRNLKASANVDKDLAKRHLGFSVPKRFPFDPRKYSINTEFSYAIDSLGIAASTESNVIYSQNSFLPRSTSLNLTSDLFGHSFNFLEINTRQENLDKLVEHYFGPKSAPIKEKIKEFYNDKVLRSTVDEVDAIFHPRSRRDVSKAEIDNIGKQVQIKTNDLNKDLDLDLSIKAFGSEVLFLNVNDDSKNLRPEAVLRRALDDLKKGIENLKAFEETLRANLHFIDTEIVYPTSLGFPLRLTVEGTANIQVKVKGNVDVPQLIKSVQMQDGFELNIKLVPSVSVDVSGRLTLDALVVENGLKLTSTLYTATGGDLKLKYLGKGQGFDFKFGLPVQEQKLLSAEHQIVFVTREQSGREDNLPLKFTQLKDFSICLDQLSPFIGLTFCAELNGPNVGGQNVPVLPFPLAGDSKIAVTIENDDVSEYHIGAKVRDDQHFAAILIETLSKDGKQKVALEAQAEVHPQKFVKITLNSPIKTAAIEGRITDTANEKSLLVKLTHDQAEYSGKIGVGVSGDDARAVYKPLLEVNIPGATQQFPVTLNGQIVVERAGANIKYIFENVQLQSDKQTLLLQGSVSKEGDSIASDLKISDGSKEATLKGRLQVSGNLAKFNAEVTNTINPNVNFNIKGELTKEDYGYDTKFQLIHGADLSSKTNILSLSYHVTNKIVDLDDYKVGTKTHVSYPLIGLNAKVEYETTPKSFDYEIDFAYAEIKFGSELEGQFNQKQQGDYDIVFEIHGFENKVEFETKRMVLNSEESKVSYKLELNDKKAELAGKLRHVVKPNNLDLLADLTITLPTHTAPFKTVSALKLNNNEIDLSEKITTGGTVIVDLFLKSNKNLNANGSLKVNIKDHLSINGQLKSVKGNGNSDLVIDIQNGNRQLKADSTFNIQPDSIYNVVVNIYPIFNKDKTQKITLSTQNKVSTTSVDSKNIINVFGNKLEANAKAAVTGDQSNGKVEGELELILPTEQYLLGKLNSDHKEENDLHSGQNVVSVEYRKNKNTPGRKVSVTGNFKNSNVHQGIFDIDYKLAADDSNGQNINADIVFKNTKQGNANQLNLNYKIYGSTLKHPLETNVISQYSVKAGQYELRTSYGPQTVLDVKGQYDVNGNGKPYSGDVTLNLITPSESLKTLQASFAGSVLKPQDSQANSIQVQNTFSIFADDDGKNAGPIIDVKGQGNVKLAENSGEITGNLQLTNVDPLTLAVTYGKSGSNDNQKFTGSSQVGYGSGKVIKSSATLERLPNHHYKLATELSTPYEGYKDVKLNIDTQRQEKDVKSNIDITVDGKAYNLNGLLSLSELAPIVDLKLRCPDGKLSQIHLKGNKVSNKEFSGDVKVVNEAKNFNLDSNLDVNVQTIENFAIKGKLNSPTLNLNKIEFEAQNRPGKNDNKIHVSVKADGKTVVSGNTNYATREGEHGKYIVEGSGTFTVKDEKKSGNFKYSYQPLKQDHHGEDGVEILLDAGLGDKSIDSEFKLSNKQFKLLNSYCEQKKECAHIEIDNKIHSSDINNFNQVLEVNLDLRKLGLSHEFGLKAVTTKKQNAFDHIVDIHCQSNDNNKYKYSFYIHPDQAGVSFTTPKRIVALEGKIEVPKDVKNGGKTVGEIVFYVDKKNHANKKTALSYFVDVNVQGRTVNAEVKFTHPGLQRPLLATLQSSGQLDIAKGSEINAVGELDIFAQPNQKIVFSFKQKRSINEALTQVQSLASGSIKSKGLGIDIQGTESINLDRDAQIFSFESKLNYHVASSKYENEILGRVSQTEANAVVKLLNVNIIKVINKFKLTKEEQIIDSEVSSYDNNAIISRLEVKNLNTLKFSAGEKKSPNNKIQVNAGLIPGQIADLRADHLNGNQKTNLFHATVKLDDANFLRPDYNVNSKEIEQVIAHARKRSTEFVQGLENVGKEFTEDIRKEAQQINELTKKSAPNLKPIKQFYTKELNEIKEEILSDKSLKELEAGFRKVLGALYTAASELLEKVSEITEKTVEVIQNSFTSVLQTIESDLVPQLKDATTRILAVYKEIADSVLDLVLGVLAKFSQIADQYQGELKDLTAAFGELGKNAGQFVQEVYDGVRQIILEQVEKISSEIKASPILEELKAQYNTFLKEGLPNADAILNTIREVFFTIKDTIPTDFALKNEIVDILDTIESYADKKLKNQPVNDLEIFQKIAKNVEQIFQKVIALISSEGLRLPVRPKLDLDLYALNYLKNLPNLVAVRFSPANLLVNEDTRAEVTGFLLSLVNTPRNLVAPFPLFAVLAQGQHIFTFDGNHITFPGNCNYLLARDAIHGNFTLAATLKDGQLTAITLADKQDTLTLQKGGQVKLNNAAVELPARKPNIAAFRDYETIHLKSTAGVYAICTPDLQGCSIYVSGFYHGKLRGLLGNGNNEPFDDFTIPNGKIVQSESDFGNAYKLTASCAAVQAVAHQHGEQDNPACSELFGYDSSLRYCYPFVSKQNFKTACNHGLAAGIKNTEEFIAKAYVAVCNNRNILIDVPEHLVKCTNGDKPYSVGDKFSVKLPAKAADIVLLVDTNKSNEKIYNELVTQLVQDIGKELHAKGVNDIEYHLITYGGENLYPSHVTVNGKLAFKGKAPHLKFAEAPKAEEDDLTDLIPFIEIKSIVQKLKALGHEIDLAIGNFLQAETYIEGLNYPFRANALKSIIVVNSSPCEVGKLYFVQKLRAQLLKNDLITLNLFTPFSALSVKDAKKTKDTVGFDSENVFTVAQGKKNPKGSAELYKDLVYDDYCTDFVLNNRGNVFVNDNFPNLKTDAKKTFIHIATQNIVQKLVGVEQGLDCECELKSPYSASNVCKEAFAKVKK